MRPSLTIHIPSVLSVGFSLWNLLLSKNTNILSNYGLLFLCFLGFFCLFPLECELHEERDFFVVVVSFHTAVPFMHRRPTLSAVCGSLRAFQGGPQGPNNLHNYSIEVICLFHCSDICTGSAKAGAGKTAGASAQNNAVAPSYTGCHCILHHRIPVLRTSTCGWSCELD